VLSSWKSEGFDEYFEKNGLSENGGAHRGGSVGRRFLRNIATGREISNADPIFEFGLALNGTDVVSYLNNEHNRTICDIARYAIYPYIYIYI